MTACWADGFQLVFSFAATTALMSLVVFPHPLTVRMFVAHRLTVFTPLVVSFDRLIDN